MPWQVLLVLRLASMPLPRTIGMPLAAALAGVAATCLATTRLAAALAGVAAILFLVVLVALVVVSFHANIVAQTNATPRHTETRPAN